MVGQLGAVQHRPQCRRVVKIALQPLDAVRAIVWDGIVIQHPDLHALRPQRAQQVATNETGADHRGDLDGFAHGNPRRAKYESTNACGP